MMKSGLIRESFGGVYTETRLANESSQSDQISQRPFFTHTHTKKKERGIYIHTMGIINNKYFKKE